MSALADSAVELAVEFRADGLAGPELADAISRELRLLDPAASTRARQNAAADAAGVDRSPTPAEGRELQSAGRSGRPRPARSNRSSASRRRGRGGRRRRAGVAARRAVRVAGRSQSAWAIVLQALGLVLLYWVLRNAGSVADLVGGVSRGFDWLRSPRGVPGAPTVE